MGTDREYTKPMTDSVNPMTDSVNSADISGFPKARLDAAREALSKAHRQIVRAAAKAGQEAPSAPQITVTGEGWMTRCPECKSESRGISGGRCMEPGCDGSLVCRAVVDLTIAWVPLRLAGWEFLAVVEPLVGGNLIRQVPGAQVAEGELAVWRTAEIGCDHCQTDRRRSETFVVRADGSDPAIPAGTRRCVGRSCLASFLGGMSPAALLSAIGWRDLVIAAGGNGDGEGGGGWDRDTSLEIAEFLSWTAAVVRSDGFTSKAKARETEGRSTATSDVVVYLLTPQFGAQAQDAWRKAREGYQPTDTDRARAVDVLAWARDLPGANDYELNLKLVAGQPALDRAHAGILASAVSGYARHLGEIAKRDAASAPTADPSRYLGTIGEKRDFGRVVLEKVASFDTDYGRMHVHTFRDSEGCAIVWKTGTRHGDDGSVVEMLTGTVKRHSEFRGQKQTELARCALLNAAELAARSALKAKKPRKKSAKPAQAALDLPGTGADRIDGYDRDDLGYSGDR